MALSYLALGDSYTIGEAVAVEGRWPHQLAAALRAQGVDLADPQTIATTGWTTDELDAGIDLAAPQGPFDFVSLLIGVVLLVGLLNYVPALALGPIVEQLGI